MKSIADLLIFLQYFYRGIQCDKTRNFAHGETFQVQHEIYQCQAWSLKDTQNPFRMFNFHQTSSVGIQSYMFDDNVSFSKLLD